MARLLQYRDDDGAPRAAVVDAGELHPLAPRISTYDLARRAIERGLPLADLIAQTGTDRPLPYDAVERERRLLPPLTHPQPHRMLVSLTGLTHLGGAEARDRMHRALEDESAPSDSMKMFRIGLEGGKPPPGGTGAQPEWCFKGDGSIVAAPGEDIRSPAFALDMGEEPEIVALYVVGDDSVVYRVGHALGNELTDHRMERVNYLYLGHAKLRPCSIGPELVLGALPAHLEGVSRIRRGGEVAWQRAFLTGEENMCHSLANLEAHHFKYSWHRRAGDVHAHFLGTATISFADGFRVEADDVMEIEVPHFGRPLVNRVVVDADVRPVVKAL